MSSFADAMMMASLLNNGSMFENRRQRDPYIDPFTAWRRVERQFEVREEKEKKDKEKKDKKPETKISYLEAVFWLFFLSPIIGPIWYNLENALIKTMH